MLKSRTCVYARVTTILIQVNVQTNYQNSLLIKCSFEMCNSLSDQTQMMDAWEVLPGWEAKRTLMTFKEAAHLKRVFQKTQHVSDSQMEDLWDNYLEFMVVKALCHDRGSDKGMLFSATPLMDELWHCHILETTLYDDFMKLIKTINPMMDKIHHSSGLSLTSEADKNHRRNATAIAYRYLNECITICAIIHDGMCKLQ